MMAVCKHLEDVPLTEAGQEARDDPGVTVMCDACFLACLEDPR